MNILESRVKSRYQKNPNITTADSSYFLLSVAMEVTHSKLETGRNPTFQSPRVSHLLNLIENQLSREGW